ncbi:MAG TPA: type IV pilus biogenesis/stability protein PilW [Gammaproteobacteria bacterium]|nr:type IV pilus biogenesis/stability protein PilW [Gammaproteobacteria bacterium]
MQISIIKNQMLKIMITVLMVSSLASCVTSSETTSERTKSKPNLREASKLNTQLAIGYIQEKQYKPAKEKLEKAIIQNDENLKAYKTLAYLYALLGLNEEAEEKYAEAIDLKPGDPDLSNSYGAFLCSQSKFEEAQKNFNVAYSDPFYEGIYLAESNAGSCYIQEGKLKKAEALLRKSLRVHPTLPGSLISMAEIGIKTERYLMARAYIQRYHAVRPASAESLWFQIQAERALGAKNHYMKYARQLISDFPDSDEAGWVEAQARNEKLR